MLNKSKKNTKKILKIHLKNTQKIKNKKLKGGTINNNIKYINNLFKKNTQNNINFQHKKELINNLTYFEKHKNKNNNNNNTLDTLDTLDTLLDKLVKDYNLYITMINLLYIYFETKYINNTNFEEQIEEINQEYIKMFQEIEKRKEKEKEKTSISKKRPLGNNTYNYIQITSLLYNLYNFIKNKIKEQEISNNYLGPS